MRKSIIPSVEPDQSSTSVDWLDLNRLARVEVTSEDPSHPVEFALIPGQGSGWRAAEPGSQTVRLRFDEPRRVRRVWLHFSEPAVARTQEFVLRWATADGQPAREVVRQQWTFSPGGSIHEFEDYRVDLLAVAVLELTITPHLSESDARASLMEMRVA